MNSSVRFLSLQKMRITAPRARVSLRLARAASSFVPTSSIRSTGARLAVRSLSSTATSASSSASARKPSAFDVVVQLTFVDPNGARRQVPGLVGKTLHEVCTMHGIDIGPNVLAGDTEVVRSERWTEPTFGEGPAAGFDHVILHGKGSETAPPRTDRELSQLSDYWDDDEIFDDSRLACMIPVTKEMDGMIIYVPDRIICDIP